MAATAFGLTTPDGRDPALYASTDDPPNMRANASAIWLRLAFSTHTNSNRLTALIRTPPQPPNSSRPRERTGRSGRPLLPRRRERLDTTTLPPTARIRAPA